jgi:hypothetical protein
MGQIDCLYAQCLLFGDSSCVASLDTYGLHPESCSSGTHKMAVR